MRIFPFPRPSAPPTPGGRTHARTSSAPSTPPRRLPQPGVLAPIDSWEAGRNGVAATRRSLTSPFLSLALLPLHAATSCPPRGQSCEAPAPAIATSAAGGGWDIDWDRCYRNPECALSYPLPVEPGDIITFRWVDGQTAREHNVVRVADGAAFAGCNKAGELLGRSPASYTVPDSASPGSGIYFVCGIGSHCEGGWVHAGRGAGRAAETDARPPA